MSYYVVGYPADPITGFATPRFSVIHESELNFPIPTNGLLPIPILPPFETEQLAAEALSQLAQCPYDPLHPWMGGVGLERDAAE